LYVQNPEPKNVEELKKLIKNRYDSVTTARKARETKETKKG
jgi:hypothetical protein